ncbi:HEAT repeat-containing protein 6-like isoform X1 [Argiope bruennichi]|uniref:HEAT repeat-containing protein 6-like isoform X1 n=1 Tax=Argiope bruennichi TaxID=94029 RepID=UPI002494E323|nr:HEAT repeat-containing protein 6-like isoform X1 [Argiope bruennichi]
MNLETSKFTTKDFCVRVKKLKMTDVVELNLVIDQLNALNSLNFSGDCKEYGELLCDLANLIPPGNDHMLSKFCCLLYFSLHKQKVILQEASQEYLLEFIIPSVHSCADWVCSDVLMALSALLESSSEYNKKFKDILIGKNGVLTKFLETDYDDKNNQYNAFQCLYCLLKCSGENPLDEKMLDFCFKNCFLILKDKLKSNMGDILVLKIFITSLKCLQCVFTSKNIRVDNFGELLGTLKNLLFYGLPGQTFTQDINLYPTLRYPETSQLQESQSESDSPYPKLRKQKKNKRRLKKTPQKKQTHEAPSVEDDRSAAADASEAIANLSLSSSKFFPETKVRSSSSDSELSDAENHNSKIKSLQASLRQNAYLVLQNVVKVTDKKVIFGYWSYFLPEHPVILGLVSSPNIFTTILKDPASQVRLSALSLLAEILRGSKQFLIHADGRNARHMSFTSLSSILATMIGEIHRYLLLALLSENSNLLLIQILKCYAILSENVPYCKLNMDILMKFLKHVKTYLSHKDIQVRVACIAVFCSILNSDQIPVDIDEWMLSSDFDNAVNVANGNNSVDPNSSSCAARQSPWIIQLCQNNILNEEPLPIKIQSLQLLCSVVGKYFQKSSCFFDAVENIVLFCLNNPDTSIQLHGAKLLDIFGRSINIVTNAELKESLQPLVSALWQSVLMGSFIKCLTNDEAKTLQSVCCDCLSTLSSNDFEMLQPKQQITYITVLLGLASDSNPNVRGAAIRCLGLFCLFPSLNQDATFLDDVSVILIKSVEDPNVNVRFKASWSLGNLSDALFVSKDLLSKEISYKFFYSMGIACVRFSLDCDRVKANAVRALGNLLSYIPEQFIGIKTMQEFIKESCESLKSALSSSFMKVCWNSCYAVSNMLKNTYLIEHCDLNLNEVLTCLLKVLKSPNFKVRISAVQALTALPSRAFYGNLYPVIWQDLVSALYSTSSDVNFKEIKHQENLHDQLCFSLCQLASLIKPEDLVEIKDCILCSQEVLLVSMWKHGSRLSKEKSLFVYSTIEKINCLKNAEISKDDPTLTILLDILNQAHFAFCSQDS